MSHPERFAPLHAVADALIAHLVQTYDVELSDGPEVVEAVVSERAVERGTSSSRDPEAGFVTPVVRLEPRGAHGAPLTFVFTSFPGILLRAGLMQELVFPRCGCDACDETWDVLAEDLEEAALGIAAGAFQEFIQLEPTPWGGYQLETPDGGSTRSEGLWGDGSPAAGARAERIVEALRQGWEPWRGRPADHPDVGSRA